MMRAPFRFEQGSRTDVGCVRHVNEDAYLAREQDAVWAVADGMGGHAHGQWASARITAELEAAVLPDDFDGAVAAVAAALDDANAEIYSVGVAKGVVIGSTVTALLVRERRFAVLWAGDSRLYRLRDGALRLLTTDHSQVEQMVAAGLLTRKEAEGHPMAHLLARAVGARPELALDRRSGEVLPGDLFLLCSDGLTRMVQDSEILGLVAHEAPRRAAAALVELALGRGAADNVTVVVVGCDETTHVALG
ncbi:PP2C family protein-serine/threonine phosphatase [Sphingomonas sp. DT-51]|uniref:PP2C family protein-serine/threonine phosphatase n=1 Tax=Sphingomonas sp. DT-51 TaxID=3396165 RepID=UPI003F1BEA69